jgi:hypothetical protein
MHIVAAITDLIFVGESMDMRLILFFKRKRDVLLLYKEQNKGVVLAEQNCSRRPVF